jgi:hypothetical protein
MMQSLISQFLLDTSGLDVHLFGNGLIHSTYKVEEGGKSKYILQKMNTMVFKKPLDIAENLDRLAAFLVAKNAEIFFPLPEKTLSGEPYALYSGEYYRLTSFVQDSHSLDSCVSADQAYQAAYQFGRFTSAFEGFDAQTLKPSIPGFHDLSFRWKQFIESVENGNPVRKKLALKEIEFVFENKSIVDKFNVIQQSPLFKQRVTHHDTKINNVLFNRENKSICPIDLDTVISGFFISDLGDMFRTYLSPGSEEETDLEAVFVRKDFYQAIVEGYMERIADILTKEEKENLSYAGEFMIFMQAIRFLADFLNDDIYYGIRYEMNNFDRTVNQLHLLRSFQQK